MKILIVGLGNPGEKFANTRHNVGFKTVDKLREKRDFPNWQKEEKFKSLVTKGSIGEKEAILIQPQTFMNASGEAVRAIADYNKISPENIIVIHDELDVPLGKYKIARDRSSAGHKGVQSIIDMLKTKDFTRFRIGIGAENKKIPTEAFVLENFTEEEEKIMKDVIEKVVAELERMT